MDSFQLLCDRLLQTARSHSEKDKLRQEYQKSELGEEWAIIWASMNEVVRYYDRIHSPVEGK